MFRSIQGTVRCHIKPIISKRSYSLINNGINTINIRTSILNNNHTLPIKRCKNSINNLTYQQLRFNAITASTDGSNIPEDVKNLTIEEYHKHSSETFEQMLDELDLFFEENKIMEAEIDEEAGVMQINCSEGSYVINKQPPTKQIWLSSPISGPKRFDYHNNQWISLRDNIKLSELLQEEMNLMYGNFNWSKPF